MQAHQCNLLVNVHAETLTLLFMFCVCLLYCLVCSLQPWGHLLRKGYPLALVDLMFYIYFSRFPIWCLGLGIVLDYIDF